jgi:hypothetical protein
MGTAARRRTFPVNHVTLREIAEREELLRVRNTGTLCLSDRIRLKVLMARAINPDPDPPIVA